MRVVFKDAILFQKFSAILSYVRVELVDIETLPGGYQDMVCCVLTDLFPDFPKSTAPYMSGVVLFEHPALKLVKRSPVVQIPACNTSSRYLSPKYRESVPKKVAVIRELHGK